ncbi:MBL fold metallo-hydrolase [Ottowia thiooxydans]|uniref:Glyoxylase-like metal-dependent hydrolase (Beta-lactamase superfamily II) n=1 Tax=Ottowia thiooxydans TaxID=219182 RepID=A0ABV2Q3D3_9BURK
MTAPTSSQVQTISQRLWRRRNDLPALQYHEADIPVGLPVELTEGIFLVRLPLPFALNHINLYLIREAGGWTLIDTGINTQTARDLWDSIFESSFFTEHGPLTRIVVTHHHPDHIGMLGWIAQKFPEAPVYMTAGELEVAGRYSDPKRDVVAERTPLWIEHGIPAVVSTELINHMPRYGTQVGALPTGVRVLDTSTYLELGGQRWIPIIGRGHSPEHLSLLREDGQVLIGGDQVLPKITPNIAVWPGGDQNPLYSYLDTLRLFEGISASTLLLPSHKQPFNGVARRVEEIRAHHEERLSVVLNACDRPMTGYEFLPALFGRQLHNEQIGFGLGEAIAHLNYLESVSLLTSSVDDTGLRRFERT